MFPVGILTEEFEWAKSAPPFFFSFYNNPLVMRKSRSTPSFMIHVRKEIGDLASMNRPICTSPGRTIDKPDMISNAKKEFDDLIMEENKYPRNWINILFPEALFIKDLVRILLELE